MELTNAGATSTPNNSTNESETSNENGTSHVSPNEELEPGPSNLVRAEPTPTVSIKEVK